MSLIIDLWELIEMHVVNIMCQLEEWLSDLSRPELEIRAKPGSISEYHEQLKGMGVWGGKIAAVI